LFVKPGMNEFYRRQSFRSPRSKDLDLLPFSNPALNTFNHRCNRFPDMMDSDSAMIFGQGAVQFHTYPEFHFTHEMLFPQSGHCKDEAKCLLTLKYFLVSHVLFLQIQVCVNSKKVQPSKMLGFLGRINIFFDRAFQAIYKLLVVSSNYEKRTWFYG